MNRADYMHWALAAAIFVALILFPALDSEEPKRVENKVEDVGLDDA